MSYVDVAVETEKSSKSKKRKRNNDKPRERDVEVSAVVVNDDDDDFDKPLMEMDENLTATLGQLERLLLSLQTNPENADLNAIAIQQIRKFYRDNGGLPINVQDPIPHDLTKLSPKELSNVLENMIINTVKTKQKHLVDKAMQAIGNVAYLGSLILGLPTDIESVKEFQGDDLLRQSFIEVFMGGVSRLSPLLTLAITVTATATNIAVKSVDGFITKRRRLSAEAEARRRGNGIPVEVTPRGTSTSTTGGTERGPERGYQEPFSGIPISNGTNRAVITREQDPGSSSSSSSPSTISSSRAT